MFMKVFLLVISFVIVAFGQPAWAWWTGLIAAALGYTLFWKVLLKVPSTNTRFLIATGWFTAVQLVQTSWMLSHPFYYIFAVYILVSLILGCQFGLLSLLVTPVNLSKLKCILGIAAIWTLFEWSRFFILSGFTFNPSGLALTGDTIPLQMATIGGIFGLSFWVFFTNLLGIKAWLQNFALKPSLVWVCAILFPYLFGVVHLYYHEGHAQGSPTFKALLVQTGFPVEENESFEDMAQAIKVVLGEWKQIAKILKKHEGQKYDLIAIPEGAVPFGAYSAVFPYDIVKNIWSEVFGPEAVLALPNAAEPYTKKVRSKEGEIILVNNVFWAQGLTNLMQTPLVIGLQDACQKETHMECYQSALYLRPDKDDIERYDKRVLIPMGEYIPFSFMRDLAAKYGVYGFFTHGEKAKVWSCSNSMIGMSICYEETYGYLMRDNRIQGAEILVNLTSDAWFPDSLLPYQHLDLARLRTVELGVPLLRSCNTGITCGIDSLGRTVAVLGEGNPHQQWISDALPVEISTYHYNTIYGYIGDFGIIGLCVVLALVFLVKCVTRNKTNTL